MKLFAVFEEGGLIVDLPMMGWLSAIRCGVPIIGFRFGEWRLAHDRIMWGFAKCGPFRIDRPYRRQIVFPFRAGRHPNPHSQP